MAISAIAKETKSSLEALGEATRYLAGIWEAQLPGALAWRVHPDSVCEGRPVDYRAPSWSWAAVDGEIVCPWQFPGIEVSLAEVMSAKTALLTDDETGQVTDGAITLQAAVLPATVGDVHSRQWYKRTKAEACRQVTFPSFRESGLQGVPGSMIEVMAQASSHFDTYADIFTDIQFIPLSLESRLSMLGLALVPGERGFRRVGMIEIEIPTEKEAVLAWIGQLPRQTVIIR